MAASCKGFGSEFMNPTCLSQELSSESLDVQQGPETVRWEAFLGIFPRLRLAPLLIPIQKLADSLGLLCGIRHKWTCWSVTKLLVIYVMFKPTQKVSLQTLAFVDPAYCLFVVLSSLFSSWRSDGKCRPGCCAKPPRQGPFLFGGHHPFLVEEGPPSNLVLFYIQTEFPEGATRCENGKQPNWDCFFCAQIGVCVCVSVCKGTVFTVV